MSADVGCPTLLLGQCCVLLADLEVAAIGILWLLTFADEAMYGEGPGKSC